MVLRDLTGCRSRGVCKHEDVVDWQIVLNFDLFTLREILRKVTYYFGLICCNEPT